MAGILKVDRIQEANSGQGVELSHKLVDTSGNTIISENNGVATFGSSVAPSTNYTFRNKIINGNFDIWQRGTSQQSAGYGSADRWNNDHSGSSKTASQEAFTLGQTEVPGNPKYYLRHVVTSVSGAGNYCLTQQKMEGVETLAGKTATLSFWARTTDSNKNIATGFNQFFGNDGSPSSTVGQIGVTTHNLTTSWQKFTTTVFIPSISGKTIGTDGRDYLHLIFWFESGSTYSADNNSLGNQSGTFDIAQVQVEEGTVATPFEHRPIGTELALCQRYYEKSTEVTEQFPLYKAREADRLRLGTIQYKVTKRATPIIILLGANGDGGATPSAASIGNYSFRVFCTSTGDSQSPFVNGYSAEAEL